MHLRRFSAQNFRNLASQELELGAGTNIFLGYNGQGKTNFLEASHLLLGAPPFRPAKAFDLINQKIESPEKLSRVTGEVVSDDKIFSLALLISSAKKTHFLGGKPRSAPTLRKLFPQVLFSPESLTSIKAGPVERRALIDSAVALHDPEGPRVLEEFEKVLRARNRLLSDLKAQEAVNFSLKGVLDSLRPLFLEKGTALTVKRLAVLQQLCRPFQEIFREVAGTPSVDISVEYVISDEVVTDWNNSRIYDALNQRLVDLARAELQTGHSLVGPQKHDLRILYNGNDSRFFCSQGQQRALILSFKMAQIVYHERVHKVRPLLLLDDVLSELDEQRRRYLVDFLGKNNSQTLITTTDFDLSRNFESSSVKVFSVDNGRIEEVSWPKKS